MKENGYIALILILALVHILTPVVAGPDPIPVIGWADDVAVGIGAGAECAKS